MMMGLSVGVISLAAMAQTTTREAELHGASAFGVNKYNRPVGLNNFKNLPDQMLQQMGKRVSAKGLPTKAQSPATRANYTASDTIFWESFEGWDGETMPWLPNDPNKWNTQSAIADLTPYLTNGSCPTWTTYQGDVY